MSKQVKQHVVVSGLLSALLIAVSGTSVAGVKNSKHDLSNVSTGATIKASSGTQTEICVFCHTPHGATLSTSGSGSANTLPLWNHALSTGTSYGVYASTTMNTTATSIDIAATTNATISNLCMSCHDGAIAINSVNNPSNARPDMTLTGAGQTAGKLSAGNSRLLSSLTNSHPVNFSYSASVSGGDTGLVDPVDSAGSGLGGAVKLFDGKVQCASCHDVHNSANVESGAAFLRVTMDGSSLCFKCHNK